MYFLYLILTIAVYFICLKIYNKFKFALLNPVLISIITLVSFLMFFQIDYQDYNKYNSILTQLLQPAVVALGVPLYKQLSSIRSELKILLPFIGVCTIISIILNTLLVYFISGDPLIMGSFAPKSVTTPIAILVSEQIGGNLALTAVNVVITGLVGAIFGIPILNKLSIKSEKAIGLSMGIVSHALGTARATEDGYIQGAYGAFALVVSASLCAVFCPLIFAFILNLLKVA